MIGRASQVGLIPGRGTEIPHAAEQLSLCTTREAPPSPRQIEKAHTVQRKPSTKKPSNKHKTTTNVHRSTVYNSQDMEVT